MQRFADLSRAAAIGFVTVTLFFFGLWAVYHSLDNEWDPASFDGRDYNCGEPTSEPGLEPTHRLPGTMNGNPVYVDRLPVGNYDPTLVQVRVGKRWRQCGLHGGP